MNSNHQKDSSLFEGLPREILAFQPDVVELEHKPSGGGARWTLYIVLAFILAVIIWATVAEVDRVVTARGELTTTEPQLLVQPWSTAIIRQIHVKPGASVKEGDVLVTLDPTFAKADLNEVEQQRRAVRSRYRRLSAESEGVSYSPMPDEDKAEARLQADLFQRRQEQYQSQMAQFEKAEEVSDASMATNRRQARQLKKRLALVSEIEDLYGTLLKQSNSSRVQYLEAKDSRFQVETQLFQLNDELRELRGQKDQQVAERNAYIANWRKDLSELLSEARLELSSLDQRSDKARQLSELVVLKAPASGVVLEVAERSVGSIAKEAEPLVTLVPTGSDLEVQVEVAASDIGRIREADPAVIKLDAFPFQRHGTLQAAVRTISEDAFETGDGQAAGSPTAFYRTRLTLQSRELEDVPESFRLIPGMKLTAEVKIGSRRIITYLIYPVIKAMGESLREP